MSALRLPADPMRILTPVAYHCCWQICYTAVAVIMRVVKLHYNSTCKILLGDGFATVDVCRYTMTACSVA